MSAQRIVTPAGERLVMLPEAEYEALVAAAEDASDRDAVREFRRRLRAGEEELIPAVVVDRILAGENRIRVWREHRGVTRTALGERTGVGTPFISQLETGSATASIDVLRKVAEALSVTLDDLAG